MKTIERLLLPSAFLIIWTVASLLFNSTFLPSPLTSLKEFMYVVSNSEIWMDTFYSFERLFYGLVLSIPIGIGLGLWMGFNSHAFNVFNDIIQFLRVMPITALVPLIIIIFGFSVVGGVFVIFLASFIPIVLSSIFAGQEIKEKYFNFINNLKIDKWKSFSKIILPASFQIIYPSIDIAINTAFRIMIVAELFGASSGLGFRLLESAQFLNFPKTFAILAVIGIWGLVVHQILQFIRNKIHV